MMRAGRPRALAANIVGLIVADFFYHRVPGRDNEAWISWIAADHNLGNQQGQRDTYNEKQDVLDDDLPTFAETATVIP